MPPSKTRASEHKMYENIAKYFMDAYSGKCNVYINAYRLLRIMPKVPDLVIVPSESAELVAVEAKWKVNAVSFSQALGRGTELKEFASRVYLAFNEPIPDRFQKDLVTVAPKLGLLSRTIEGRILLLRQVRKETPRNPAKANEVKEFLRRYPIYLFAERRARVEGRKHLKQELEDYQKMEDEKTYADVKRHWYDPSTNTVHVTVDDTLDDQQSLAEAVDSLDIEVRGLNLEEEHGPDVKIDLDSDIYSMCEKCGHVMAGRCERCGWRRV